MSRRTERERRYLDDDGLETADLALPRVRWSDFKISTTCLRATSFRTTRSKGSPRFAPMAEAKPFAGPPARSSACAKPSASVSPSASSAPKARMRAKVAHASPNLDKWLHPKQPEMFK